MGASGNPNEDITNKPALYHYYAGAAVRIKTYWSEPIAKDKDMLRRTVQMVRYADRILRKYSLSLDSQPQLLTKTQDTTFDMFGVPEGALLPYNGITFVPYEGGPSRENYVELRKLVDRDPPKEDRLIVVFTPITPPPSGFTILLPDWLPWVLVDPRSPNELETLLHEIGHACRLAHADVGPNTMEQGTADAGRFWNWQVDYIDQSYWCEGLKYKNWYNTMQNAAKGLPTLWDE